MLRNITNYKSFKNSQENLYGGVYPCKVPNLKRTGCNFAINRLCRKFVLEYVPKVVVLKRTL